jgi:hypothetical protein
MPTGALRIRQIYKTERLAQINITTNHHDVEDALEEVRSGSLSVPIFEDPR